METGSLRVPGASIYYEARGSGSLLLLIPGGNGDTAPYLGVAETLADRYKVVTYDRRGFSRSPLDGPVDDDRRLETDSEDVHHLLAHFADEPAFVFGSSSGAIVALDYLTRYPGEPRTVVAHEPPIRTLLPDSAEFEAFFTDVYETYRSSGTGPAMAKFMTGIGLDTASRLESRPENVEPPAFVLEMMGRMRHNQPFWFEHELLQYTRFVADVATLKASVGKLVLAGGRDSHEQFAYRPNTVLADQLGVGIVDFVGGHIGYSDDPAEFSAQLDSVLAGSPAEVADQTRLS